MGYRFKLTENNALLNFSESYCHSSLELLESEAFHRILEGYITNLRKKNNSIYLYLRKAKNDDEKIIRDLKIIAKLLMVMNVEDILHYYDRYRPYFENREAFVTVVEEFYLYWRRLQRYAIVFNEQKRAGFQNVQFVDAQNKLEELVLLTYRQIEETIMGYHHKVYRQITAGVNAGLIVSKLRTYLPYEYRELDNVPFIESVIIHPPFITYSKRNKRDGIFPETNKNPIDGKKFDEEEWFCYPAKVGDLLAFIYFNIHYMAQGVTLCNLFELAEEEDYRNRKPDILYVYGYEDGEMNQSFYQDDKNDMVVACLSRSDEFDYFGYMKKMVLTLHNIRKINQEELPIHGAMVQVTLHSGVTKNIVVMGDSGAGKSETIEQIKVYGSSYIRDLKTIYDDMGLLSKDENGVIKTSGTEIGAFVRLDDLDAGYGYKELDRSVFMNPDKINARIVIPITSYKDVVNKHDVDLFLYANNYDESKESLIFFDSIEESLKVFRAGSRMAKGTTTEYGLVDSYFANPFGPVQREEQTDKILVDYFESMFEQGIKVGELRTRLGIAGNEHKGPKQAAIAILEYITGEKLNIKLDT